MYAVIQGEDVTAAPLAGREGVVEGRSRATLRWSEVPDPVIEPGQVLLRVHASAVNRADLLQAQGLYPPPVGSSPYLGLEAAGEVVATSGPVGEWRLGDRGMALLQGGGFAELVAVDARHLLPIPRALTLSQAGGVMEVFVTAYLNVMELGGLKRGERLLVSGGSGGVGSAAIQLGVAAGATVFTTAGAPERVEHCLRLGAHEAFDHRGAGDAVFRRLAELGGADVVLDCMGASHLDRNLSACAPGGRCLVLGLQGGRRATIDLGRLLTARLTLKGSTLRGLPADDKAALLERFRATVWPELDAGRLRVVTSHRFRMAETDEALDVLRRGEHLGKILLTVA